MIRTASYLLTLIFVAGCGNSGVPLTGGGVSNPPSAPPAITTDSPLPAPATPLTLVSDVALSERLHELTVMSPALEGETKLRLLLPTNYDAKASTRYPVLFLMHGCCNFDAGFSNWSRNTDLVEFTKDLPVLIVMPEGGNGGNYCDWYNNGMGGPPRWETYHMQELAPWVEQNYQVRRDRMGRMLMGMSMGGFGAFHYAAKYPQRFGSASAFSPAIDTNVELYEPVGTAGPGLDYSTPSSIWGPRSTEEIRWRGQNPWDLAENLGTTALFIRTGNGTRPGDPAPSDSFEIVVHQMAVNVHNELTRLGIAHTFVDYGEGTHNIAYWQEGLHTNLPLQLALAQQPRPDPRNFSHRSIDPAFTVYGWEISIAREALEFARLGEVSEAGFTLSGSGQAVVKTARWFVPGKVYRVQVGDAANTLTSNAEGRLEITVDLGASRSLQQYRPTSPAGYLKSVAVSITP